MKILVAGASGFVGKRLVELAKDHSLILLSRNQYFKAPNNCQVLTWNGKDQGNWTQSLNECDAIINLCGESVAAARWTLAQKQKILQSRIEATSALVTALKNLPKDIAKNKVLINASAVGFYGSNPGKEITEETTKGSDFLAETCVQWEEQALKAQECGTRVALMRLGVVLGKNGGALAKMLPPFKMFVGGPLGNGKQYFPWVHIDDVVSALLFASENKTVSGAVNVSGPEMRTMKEFSDDLGKVLHRPSLFAVPEFALRIIAGEMADMLLADQKVVPQKLQQLGFKFKYSTAKAALSEVINS